MAFQIDELVKCGAWIFHARMTDGIRVELGLGPQRAQRTNDANIREILQE